MIREEIIKLLKKAIDESGFKATELNIERPPSAEFGDYAASVVLQIAKTTGLRPQEIGEIMKSKIEKQRPEFLERVEVAAPGFINFFISQDYLHRQIEEILGKKDKFGEIETGKGQKINIEFISANPTGPLTLGNGRGGFCGDVLANVIKKAGYKVTREYYINDRGEQVIKLGHSVLGGDQAVYKGEYIGGLRKRIKGDNPEKIGEEAAKIILEEMVKPSIKKMGISFDVWFSEKSMYQKKEVAKVLNFLKDKGLAYEKDGALWFKSTQFNDDKDRVLVKAGGEETYFSSDIAYLKNKFGRGFEKLIFFWGADHYGYIERLKAAAAALGHKKEQLDIVIMQLVRLFQAGSEVRMSKRTGTYVTMDELIDEVGLDVARFFFLTKSPESHLNFDLDLAKEQSEKNPVFYVQYAYARICSILRKTNLPNNIAMAGLLSNESELNLIKQLIRLPEVVEDTAKDYQVQRLPQYATDLAASFHQFYRDCQVISEDKNLTKARLALVSAAKIVLKNTLSLMGISAPEKM